MFIIAKKSWIKPRHRLIRNIAYLVLYPYARLKYGVRVEKFKEKNLRQYLILLNHQTVFDQFFVGMSFKKPIYYLATEDIFSNGWVSSLIRYLVAPIPIKKQTTDVSAVKKCLTVAREGGTIAIAPEGNRTYSGKTEYMSPTIAPLARKLRLPIVLYRIEGGYGVQPRWSDVIRKGKMRAYAAEVIEPEEYEKMTDEELFSRIENGLYVNEAVADGEFHHKRRAEYLERLIYVCKYCGLSSFESNADTVICKTCGKGAQYCSDKRLKGIGFDFPFEFVNDWYEYQKDFVNSLDVTEYINKPIFCDKAKISEVIVYKKKVPLRENADLCLYGDRIVVDEGEQNEFVFSFDETSAVTVLGRNKLNIYHNKRIYQVKGNKRFNAIKYVNLFNRYRNIKKGDLVGEFLGL